MAAKDRREVAQMMKQLDATEYSPAQETEKAKPQRMIPRNVGGPVATGVRHWKAVDLIAICDRVANGETLTRILKEKDTPSYATFFKMLQEDEAIAKSYRAARAVSANGLVERTLDEADSETDPAMAALLRVKSDSRRWAAARFAPETFGETKRLEVSGEVRHAHVHDLAPEQRRRIAEEWLMSGEASPTPPRKAITIDARPDTVDIDASPEKPSTT